MTRLAVRKTYKLYINGEFPRTESGRFYPVRANGGDLLANACRGSRKDLRNAVVAARKAQSGWSGKTAYNRGQILYRIAEVCESRAAELADELRRQGASAVEARREIDAVIDRWVYYAGWSDKYAQVFGSVNPVAGPYYNFTVPEPTGVVGVVAPEEPSLLGLVSRIAPVIVGGNTVIAITSESKPLAAITMGEVFETSDVPAGVINLISGLKSELVPWLAAHMDVNAIDTTGVADEAVAKVQQTAAENVKRVVHFDGASIGWDDARRAQSPYAILDFQESKTVWHPMGM
ncbi:MAG: aldehyde dehydrogenase family protein [Acidobacteria bacterium]|nr:aldehyde dehydrogenase family protein [Acidobacteriota bacterium]MBV9478563.1 aldehyde dehydrogenase family protein [Acidobacteriota bacterium]